MGTGQPGVDALKKMGAAEGKLVNFPYFIDVTLYAPPKKRSVPDSHLPIRFISSGRLLNSHKGYDVALRALAEAGRMTGAPFEYYLAGTGSDGDALRRLADQLGISSQVKFLGWVEPDALIEQYDSAHVLIHPSPTHEPYGVAVLEAMAKGLPVLASDATCAALDRVKEGINGFIHPAGDATVLATQIAYFLEHPKKLAQMGQKARETAEEWPIERGIQIIKCHVLET
jgi:glycosyltransferase involved in cell wall biosynthesis